MKVPKPATAATVQAAVAALLALGPAASATAHDVAAPKGQEKCYGIAKAGQNACANARHDCATMGKVDRDPEEWVLVAEGACAKAKGSTRPPEPKKAPGTAKR